MTRPTAEEMLALEICADAGVRAGNPRAILGEGTINHVVAVDSAWGRVIVRWQRDPARADRYAVERWCLGTADAHGIAVPRELAAGVVDGVPYLLLEYVEGAKPAPTPDTWRRLGRLAARIAGLPFHDAPEALFTRFGRDADRAWQLHLDYNLTSLAPDDPLLALGVHRRSDVAWLRERIAELGQVDLRQGLDHGDLVPGNVLMASDRTDGLVVIDWGEASIGPAPWSALDRLHRWEGTHHQVADAERWFRQGAGLTGPDAEHLAQSLFLLKSLDLVRWALDRSPGEVDRYADQARREVDRVRER